MNKLVWLLILGCLLWAEPAAAKDEPVKITADKVSGDSEKKITYLEGNVRIVQGKTIITTAYVTVNLDQKTAVLGQGAQLTDPDVTIESGRLDYNLRQKAGTFRGQVYLKRTQSGNAAKDPFELTGEELYFESDSRNFKAGKDCRLKHKEFDAKADRIEYDDAGQRLEFKGNVIIAQEDTVVRAEAAAIDLVKKQLRIATKVELASREKKITAEGLNYDYEKKTGAFDKDVVLTRAEVKDAEGKTIKDPFTLRAAGLYFEIGPGNFTASGGRIEHREFTGAADKIDYIDKRQLLTLQGSAGLKRSRDEELIGDRIEISLEDQSISVHQKGTVKLHIGEEKKE